MYNNLRFFNGLDNDLNLLQNAEGIWKGTLYLDEVSVQLYETVNLFVLEECKHLGDLVANTPVAENAAATKFIFKWQKDTLGMSDDIIMYSTKLSEGKIIKENAEMKLDMSAIAKGYTSDLIARFLAEKGCENYMVEIGGEVAAKGKNLEFALGYSHPINFIADEGITFKIDSPTEITVVGIDKQLVGETAAKIQKLRKVDPYKGKGLHLEGAYIRRKQGKTGKK